MFWNDFHSGMSFVREWISYFIHLTQSIGPRSENSKQRCAQVSRAILLCNSRNRNEQFGHRAQKKESHILGSFLYLNANDIVFGKLVFRTSPAGLLWAASSSKRLRVPLEGGTGDIILRLPNRMRDPCLLSSQCSRLGLEKVFIHYSSILNIIVFYVFNICRNNEFQTIPEPVY